MPVSCQYHMVQAEGDEAHYRGAEGEVLHAPYWVGVVQGDVQHPGHIAGQQGHGDRDVEHDGGDGEAAYAAQCPDEQDNGKGYEKVGDFISVFLHGVHILFEDLCVLGYCALAKGGLTL